jgi:hypothetical protein
MRKWLVVAFLLGVLTVPFSASAQGQVKLGSLEVQLWPEYDQPSMLLIYDFKLPEDASLPAAVSIHMPKDANLIAVASQAADGALVNAEYEGPTASGDWQVVTIKVQTQTTYHLEFYEPLSKSGTVRQFTYLWPGDYAADDFSISLRVPVDTTNITTDPTLQASQAADGASYLLKDFGPLAAGQQVTLNINYTKTSDKLSVAQQNVQPSAPLNANTPGRVMLSNYLPYILGGLGLILIVGGLLYFWRSGRGGTSEGRRRHPAKEDERKSDVYCHQCGTRAQVGDRFCRVCGTKLRLAE